MSKITDEFLMPTFTLDDKIDNVTGKRTPGIKTMFEIAWRLQDSIMIWGQFGLGKSQAVQQWNDKKVKDIEEARKHNPDIKPWNPKVCDVRLSMKEPVDMIGIPIITGEGDNKSTVWATPSMWPKGNEYCGGVILLDEMNQGQAAILNAAFQLIQDRALGEYKVPEGYVIIAASNPPALNSTVTDLSLPLSNRFSHFNVRSDFESWLNYRMNSGGNVDVMTFLKTQDSGLLFDDASVKNKIGEDAAILYTDVIITPRSWEVVEKLLDLNDPDITFEDKRAYATGRLGLTVANKFFEWIKNKSKYQPWQEILVDKKPFKSEDVNEYWVTQMACISAILNVTDDKLCREYILNLMTATRKLKNDAYKVITVTQLLNSPRIKGNYKLFNIAKDCNDIVSLAMNSLY